jgi:hypothetical protein
MSRKPMAENKKPTAVAGGGFVRKKFVPTSGSPNTARGNTPYECALLHRAAAHNLFLGRVFEIHRHGTV